MTIKTCALLGALAATWSATAGNVLPLTGNGPWRNGATYRADRTVIELYPEQRPLVEAPASKVKGHFKPRPTAFHLKGVKDVTLDFGGATLLLHGRMQPFILECCTNVTIANVTVKNVRSPYTQGTILKREGNAVRVRFGKDFPVSVENGALYFIGDGWRDGPIREGSCFMQCFDPKTRRGRAIFTAFFADGVPEAANSRTPWARHSPRFSPRQDGEDIILTSDRPLPGGVAEGNVFVIGHSKRDFSNVEMAECRDVTIRNYRILNGRGMGIFPFHCHNVTLDGVKMTWDETSPSFISNAADGIHAFACSGEFIIRNCIVEATIDDALNVHGNYYTVTKAEGRTIEAFTGLEPLGTTAIFRPGDRIAVMRGYTLDRTGEYVITAVETLDEKHVRFTVDRPVGQHAAKDMIENLSAQCHLVIANSRFGKGNAHLRLQTRGGIEIDNCETEWPFILTGDMNYWFESSPCETLVVRNTRFIGERAVVRSCPEFTRTKDHPFYHGDILVENCTFDMETPLFAGGAKSMTAWRCKTSAGKSIRIDAQGCPNTKRID